jgi:hypothetical protein
VRRGGPAALPAALGGYEAAMLQRSAGKVLASREAAEILHSAQV